MTAIDKVIGIAKNEIGYLEKNNSNNLYDKTANAGSGNYTKYWAEIKPEYQSEPWCAAFVTWVLVQAFGKDMAKKLLKHYPYVYCPTMADLFVLNANPKKGDIVIFKRNGTFTHTGIVISVSGDYFETVEGNTSCGSSIIANGVGVCKKGYYNSNLPGTKFCTPAYEMIEREEEKMTDAEKAKMNAIDESLTNLYRIVTEVKNDIADIRAKVNDTDVKYDYMDNNMPQWAKPTIQKMMDKGLLEGDENSRLRLTDELLRVFVTNDRAGLYDYSPQRSAAASTERDYDGSRKC